MKPETYKELLVQEALKYLGHASIKHGRCNKGECHVGLKPETGFDCSGFITYLLTKIQYPLDSDIRHCREYFDSFGVPLHFEARQKGDLIVFSRNGRRPTHMGILLSPAEYIHAPGTNGSVVKIDELKVTPLPARYKDQLYFTNPIGFKRIAV